MSIKMNMPQLGYDMSQGTVIRWLKEELTPVKTGEPIVEIETDKAVVEVESEGDGILSKILISEGVSVPVGTPIAIIGEEGEDISDLDNLEVVQPSEDINVEQSDKLINEDVSSINESQIETSVVNVEENIKQKDVIKASPIARRIAKEKGIDLKIIIGTGPGGRVIKEDILNFQKNGISDQDNDVEDIQYDLDNIHEGVH